MTSLNDDLAVVTQALKTQRDTLAVKIHLAKADVKDEWQALEQQWQQFNARSEVVIDEAKEVAEEVQEDLTELAQDLKDGYHRIKRLLS
ncbi:hypothetical protein [Oceanicoccus sagamiensis]|uniref:Uncharacterized protein n=1 Tax=Oceanicoccus sagamiensis TaxID=716816 RepID=A0A1X9NCR6_9GAMM|nr:hypothetical protein [Oceanicoccus sagamiensis]ARN72757.1 hypothetical protein BST96_00685 [Oceanicoccus sagamiensis]